MVYEIGTKYVYDDFSKNKKMSDFSNFFPKSKYYDELNALVVGKIKNEMSGVNIEEFVGLMPNMYSILLSNPSQYKNQKM